MTTADVIAALGRARPLDSGSAPWTLRFLDIADRQFGGTWRRLDLRGDQALAIMLPPHAGEPCCGDRLALLDSAGARLGDAARRLRAVEDAYSRENRSCWSRIRGAISTPFSEVILTPAPLDSDDHRGLPVVPDTLYHLDGLHRLLGWALAGRLTPDAAIPAMVAESPQTSPRSKAAGRAGSTKPSVDTVSLVCDCNVPGRGRCPQNPPTAL